MPTKHSGSCSCGAVRFKVDGGIKNVANCHCNRCRRINGSAFSTYAVVHRDNLQILQGDDKLSTYAISERAAKKFCSRCGSPLFNTNSLYPDYRMIYLGAFDRGADLKPRINVYCSSMLDWVPGVSDLPSFQEEFKP